MNPGARIAAFVALLAVVFAGAALAGGAVDPGGGADGATSGGHDAAMGHAAADTVTTDGYEVTLRARTGELAFVVRRDGDVVSDLHPYLGARGDLVVLREGDGAYEHPHPQSSPPSELAFAVGTTRPGTYRLFLQFRRAGRVHTAAFTRTVR